MVSTTGCPFSFDHKNKKGLKHSDEERRNTERKNENKRKRMRNRERERKRQEEEEKEQRMKVSRGRELKSKTRIPRKTNVYDPCTAEVNQFETN